MWIILAPLLKILAQALGASAGVEIGQKVVKLVDKATKGDDDKRTEVAIELLKQAAVGCPKRVQKIADETIKQLADNVSDR